MTKHFILSVDPDARFEWDRRTLRDPITADHPVLADLVAEAVGGEPGAYLVAIKIEVEVLERAEVKSSPQAGQPLVEVPARSTLPQLAEVA